MSGGISFSILFVILSFPGALYCLQEASTINISAVVMSDYLLGRRLAVLLGGLFGPGDQGRCVLG